MSIVLAYDSTHVNLGRVPPGIQLCGYTTGSNGIAWTKADWAAHPSAVRICQDAGATDRTADVLDVERGAATVSDVPGWARDALASRRAGRRPGQRWPLIYTMASNVTPVANALTAAKLTGGQVGLFVADWNDDFVGDVTRVSHASGPFPVHGWQVSDAGLFDVDVFSADWLKSVA